MEFTKLSIFFKKWISCNKLNKHFRKFNVYYNVCTATLTLSLTAWLIQQNYIEIFTSHGHQHKADLWVKIIENLEILVFAQIIVLTAAETVIESKTRNELPQVIHESISTSNGHSRYTLVCVTFYASLAFILMFQLICDHHGIDQKRFILSVLGQFYLLSNELQFVSLILKVSRTNKNFNQCLNDRLRRVMPLTPAVVFYINGTGADKLVHLHDFSNTYWLICEYITTVNRTHGLRLFSMVVCIFYKIMFIPYSLYLNLIQAYSVTVMKELTNACLFGFHLAELLLLAFSADSATKQAEHTLVILCEQVGNNDENEEISDAELFLSYFGKQKAEFKIMSLFTLHRPFVLTIFGAVTTYIIIFVQLQDTLNLAQIFNAI